MSTQFQNVEHIYGQPVIVQTKIPKVDIDIAAIFEFLKAIRGDQTIFKVPIGLLLECIVEPHRRNLVVDQTLRRLGMKRIAFVGWQLIFAVIGWKITSIGIYDTDMRMRLPIQELHDFHLEKSYYAWACSKYIEINGLHNATRTMALAFKHTTWQGAFKTEISRLAIERKSEFDCIVTADDLQDCEQQLNECARLF